MALTREEIKQIVDAVADRIITSQLVCSCGYSALGTARSGADFRDEIYAQRIKGVEEELPNFLRAVAEAEVACHINLDEAKELAREAAKAAREGDWKGAQIPAAQAENSIEDTLYEAATKQKS